MCRNSHRDTLPLICSKIPTLSILALICTVTLDVSGSFVHSMGRIWLLRKVLEAGHALRLINIWCLTGEKQMSRVCGYSQRGTCNCSQKKPITLKNYKWSQRRRARVRQGKVSLEVRTIDRRTRLSSSLLQFFFWTIHFLLDHPWSSPISQIWTSQALPNCP